jgi:hypothetical protein
MMRVAIVEALAMILAARPFGRWRANVWLKANIESHNKGETYPQSKEQISQRN